MNTNYIGNNRQNDISEALINSTKIKTDKTNSYKKHNFEHLLFLLRALNPSWNRQLKNELSREDNRSTECRGKTTGVSGEDHGYIE